ncbi:uncharacterized protein METZ01_LOCUS191811 [marine metagenome]|uniref:Uncharacterized protein n=1 Tax=marine metagenome TaxID=408172 RepID=A0A382DMW6_9ZZZZ
MAEFSRDQDLPNILLVYECISPAHG